MSIIYLCLLVFSLMILLISQTTDPYYPAYTKSLRNSSILDSGFLSKFNIFNSHQNGFRQQHSTYMAVLELVNDIFQGFENNEYTIMIFVDLKKLLILLTIKFSLKNSYFMVFEEHLFPG